MINQLSNDFLLGAIATHTGQISGRSHRLRGGVLFNRGRTKAANFVNVAGSRGVPVSSATQTATNVEAFFEDQLALVHGFTLVLGASASTNQKPSRGSRPGGQPADRYSKRER